jgi:hypothetical protein
MKKISIILAAIVWLLIFIAGCSGQKVPVATSTPQLTPTAATCKLGEVGALIDQGLAVFQKFKAQIDVIRATPGIDLPGAIEKLKEIKTEAEKLRANPCAGRLYGILVEGMNKSIEQVAGLLTDSSNAAQAKLSEAMDVLFMQISAEITRLFKCLPNC